MKNRWMIRLALWLALSPAASGQDSGPAPGRTELRVGIDEGDLRGSDQRVLQAAVDQVAGLGGGTVRILPGRYLMRNALRLRDHVRIVGTPGQSVLVGCDGVRSRLACDGDCRERQITLADPAGFRIGDGVAIKDERSGGGFEVTTATLVARVDDRTFRISAPLYLDYMVAQKASASVAFPIVGGWNVTDALLEGVTIEGNREKRDRLDGCRGGGIYLFESSRVTFRNCEVRHYHGDGISFQVSDDVVVEGCRVEGNSGLGIHPGSGSQRPVVRGNESRDNGGDGIYVCWRVKHGLFERNQVSENRGSGISIGHKDTDNLFRENVLKGNARSGVTFRDEAEPMGAHRNVFEKNVILDNGRGEEGKPAKPSIVILGHHHGLVFRGNTIGQSAGGGSRSVGISLSREAEGFLEEGNQFSNVEKNVAVEK